MVPIYLSTGCYNKKEKTIEDMILRAASDSHNIHGIELSFLRPNEMLGYGHSIEIGNALKGMECSMHMPTKGINYEKNDLCDKLIEKALDIYSIYSCKHAVFHYENINSFEYLLEKFEGKKILVENRDMAFGKDCIKEMKPIFDSYQKIGMVLDLEHAKSGAKMIAEEFEDKIFEIHWSSPKSSINHDSYGAIFKRFEDNIGIAKKLNKPLVIEVELRNEEELKKNYSHNMGFVIKQEIDLLNEYLNGIK